MIRKTKSREKLLYSARKTFFNKGYVAVSMDEIAETAGVSKATIYRQFVSKEELFKSLIVEFFENIRSCIENILLEDTCFTEKLEKFVKTMCPILRELKPYLLKDLQINEPILFMFFLNERAKTIEGELKKLIQQGIDREVINSDYQINLVSKMILVAIEQLSLPEFIETNSMTYDEVFRQVIMIITKGICK
jgi:AcrR family transcriptional regulator